MKVYLLWKGDEYEGPWLLGVYSTEEKAEAEKQDRINFDRREGDTGNWYHVGTEEVK